MNHTPFVSRTGILSRYRSFGVALAILALVFVAGPVLRAAEVEAQVFSVSGSAEYKGPASNKFAPLTKGLSLPVGSTVRTGDNGVAVIRTTSGSAVRVGNNSIIKISALAFASSGGAVTERKVLLNLQDGVVTALVDPKTPKVTDFKIQTPQGAAAARGTFYAVLVYKGKTYVGVKEGRVAASSNGQ